MLNQNIENMKTCKHCKIEKSDDNFAIKPTKAGRSPTCNDCRKALSQKAAQKFARVNAALVYERHLEKIYGLSMADHAALLAKQGGGCAICGATKGSNGTKYTKLQVDHDHRTGKVRGLVCIRCNGLLGKSDEMIPLLTKALAYLQKEKQ